MSEDLITKKPIEYSIVIPLYNEEGSLKPLFAEILNAMTPLGQRYEIVFVNDGSTDQSKEIVETFQKEIPEIVQFVDLKERGGQTHAMSKGIAAVRGKIVATLDSDLQNDPADIPKLLEKMKEGFDCVCGWRKARQDTFVKARLSKGGNVLQRLFTGLKIHDVSCTLRIYTHECAKNIPLNWEGQHRFIPLCLSLQGYRIGEIVSHHRNRQYGVTKYSHKRIFRVVRDFFKILKSRGKA